MKKANSGRPQAERYISVEPPEQSPDTHNHRRGVEERSGSQTVEERSGSQTSRITSVLESLQVNRGRLFSCSKQSI